MNRIFSERLLLGGLFAIVCFLACAEQISAQEAGEELVAIRLEAINLTHETLPGFYFRGITGEYEPLVVGDRRRGDLNQLAVSSSIVLYLKGVDENGDEIMKPIVSESAPDQLGRYIIFFFRDASGGFKTRIVSNSAIEHPGGSVRIINLTQLDIVCLLDQERVALSPGVDLVRSIGSTGKDRFRFAFGLIEPKFYKSPVKTLPLRSKEQRVLTLFSYAKREMKTGETTTETVLYPDAVYLYDSVNR
ncbi:hypothetical protein [Coraliomargarita parva]|uniref:hypothetical protein n=1 Tax=Coraliomargarita parva TaxID=3014050 RepID=UPI0022B45C55|nr:hypothetical protein [Coraliomargarita parva]